jgi:hypothetical protein
VKDTLRVLGENPEICFVANLGSGIIHWLGILNPILSFVSLSVAIVIGAMTIYERLKNKFK